MKKNIIIIGLIFFTILSILFLANINKVYAEYDTSWTSSINTSNTDAKEANKIVGVVLGVVQAAGVTIAVITLSVIGIRYMLGSTQEKVEYKKSMIPYLIGAILLFATSAVLTAIKSLVD